MSVNNNNNNNGNGNGNGNGSQSHSQACAACKHQRRKCGLDCILAPYFPHDRQRQFLNCHKLFGVKKITKIVRNLHHPPHKHEAMRTIIFQSDVRAADPVGGCYRIIRDLQHQIDYTKAELDLVLQHLALHRAAAAHHQQPPPESDCVADDPLSYYYRQNHHPSLLDPPPPHNYVVQQQQQYNHNPDINAWVMHDVLVTDGGFVDVDDIKPLLGIRADGDDGVDVDRKRFALGVFLLPLPC